eukprot:1791298-Alexandrium_andersonii.AAC.1
MRVVETAYGSDAALINDLFSGFDAAPDHPSAAPTPTEAPALTETEDHRSDSEDDDPASRP